MSFLYILNMNLIDGYIILLYKYGEESKNKTNMIIYRAAQSIREGRNTYANIRISRETTQTAMFSGRLFAPPMKRRNSR